MLTEKSKSDFDNTKVAEYVDLEGFAVADESNKHNLNKPIKLSELEEQNN